ncbi:hypothetical protein IS813_000208 [Staphylococcus pseudintermedius]|uniref:Uncharacterized protein n=1 Tax=Staphylococcus pseudintermedius TaxID=283734 RepID=A0A8H9ETN2_STAPS|nr:hypothetical protein [Staphylococcus pseudintermedius]EGQ3150159.1 hypothetical protein [Staphylococcus pseudintermedius]EGQ3197993.1 hypothetical protein [Staphylococcus pseudintermedius]EGQ4196935.1 hypothetical protein [Staphylococcus pseudintermedius]EGQ4384411.1 hypothetical protein [Staphylococcus pseudintermedius]EHC9942104.1 hypothetical protein [Staphylococcus pseudintermedius]
MKKLVLATNVRGDFLGMDANHVIKKFEDAHGLKIRWSALSPIKNKNNSNVKYTLEVKAEDAPEIIMSNELNQLIEKLVKSTEYKIEYGHTLIDKVLYQNHINVPQLNLTVYREHENFKVEYGDGTSASYDNISSLYEALEKVLNK